MRGQLLAWLANDRELVVSRIAFASRRRGDKEIFVTDYDGQNPYRVTRLDTISMTPDWSADGAEICFTTFVRGNADLYCAASSGGRARPLSDRKGLNIAPAFFFNFLDLELLAVGLSASPCRSSSAARSALST